MEKTIRFTQSGPKDSKSRITVGVHPLNLNYPIQGEEFIVCIKQGRKNFNVLFECNRENESLKTTSWPNELPIPVIGSPVDLTVVNVRRIKDYSF